MSLNIGSHVGPYEINGRLGRGGMGEVFKARDSRLQREVAIKVSAQRFSERFEREARAIAALNHPNICTLFDVGSHADAPSYLVMELIDGETLAERIAKGPIPLDEALEIAWQVAAALEAAHEKSITHRDLKPGNIKIRPDGSVKVLDFGLAKVGHTPVADVSDASPTITMAAMTEVGMILGTAAYMAPEQARGKPVDRRADVWAFGVVLYEMLAGRKLFRGEDLTEVLASVVKEQPDLNSVPQEVRRLLQACLEKDPRKRLQSVGDAKLLLDQAPAPAVVASPAAAKASWLPWAAAGVLAVAAGVALWAPWRSASEAPLYNLTVPIPEQRVPSFIALSPSGKQVVTIFPNTEGNLSLGVRDLDQPGYRILDGSTSGRMPFWSPDGRYVGFFADGRLKIAPPAGGPAQALCEGAGLGQGGTWSKDGVVLFADDSEKLRKVTVRNGVGSACEPVATKEPSRVPQFLPDGVHFFRTQRTLDSSQGVYVASLDEPNGKQILKDFTGVEYAAPRGSEPGYVLYLRGSTLMAQAFDERALEFTAEAFPALEGISFSSSAPQLGASVAANGILAYAANASRESHPVWFDRSGKRQGVLGKAGDLRGVHVSVDGKLVLEQVQNQGAGGTMVLFDLERGSETKITPRSKLTGGSAVLSPDGKAIIYARRSELYTTAIGTNSEQLLWKEPSGYLVNVSDWSRDGRYLLLTIVDPKTQADIWYLPLEAGKAGTAVKFVATDLIESQAQISPDGRWVAFATVDAGTPSVSIRPFPSGQGQWRLPVNGREPRWAHDGQGLFLSSAQGLAIGLMFVPVRVEGSGVRLGQPERALERIQSSTYVQQANVWSYAVHPDGKRFLVSERVDTSPATLNILTDWRRAAQLLRGSASGSGAVVQ